MIKCLSVLVATLLSFVCYLIGNAQDALTTERRQLFDYNWKFAQGDFPEASATAFNDKSWRSLDLPHDWSIEGQIDPKNPMGNDGGYFPAGTGWYRKRFVAPSIWKSRHVSIYFEGAYMNAEVFINGKLLGIRPYGYSSFEYDLTPYLLYGKENVISVRVDNSQQKNSRWYSGSGIYRHVWINATAPLHIDHWGVTITTPDVTEETATVQVKTRIKNEEKSTQRFKVSTQLMDSGNKNAGFDNVEVEVPANAVKEIVQDIKVNKPLLWSHGSPNLYQAQIKLTSKGKTIDKVVNAFGIRSLKFSTENGFQLNGRKVILNGGCAHHDNGALGAAAYDRAEIRKVELLKSAGFNAVRTSHNPPSEAFLDACDRLGLLVIDESFDGWRTAKTPYDYASYFDKWWQQDVEDMVQRDRNHPSIIMWSTGNEIIERKAPEAIETAKKLAGLIRENDPTRPVTSAMTTWDKDWAIFDPLFAVHDIAGYNYQLHRAASDHVRVPSRIIVQTESYSRDAFANWKLVQENEYIIGDFVWTAMDYLGESGIGRYYYPGDLEGEHWEKNFYPWHGAYCGDIDLIGWRKPISHYRDMLYNGHEKLYMAVREPNPANGKIKETMWSVWPTWESWTWTGYEGKDIQVEVYSRYPKVRLYLNDKLIGERQTTKEQEFKATFTLPYTAGTLRAVGVEEDKEVGPRVLITAGKAARIKIVADRTTIKASGQDLSYVTVEITDQNGNVQTNADNQLLFTLKGPGVIAAVDNASLKDVDPYVANQRKTWHGRALVIIKSTRNIGDINLTVSSPGLSEASAEIKAKD
ncbi:glycoside hydrolase family 2 TIM barrel-domain containing protein [Arcticibacter eurypsychrophilus]|uniref:glycoside hydrolase family 2 TIM barrel-domain containing protein n=1 Tax=Arcticibacter eurypsychrophilus TaxID=1434752 RepID=UPI00084D84AA|nr:glycoside hydrolase family 2 TIM barrel-domain containing protein [Arcticibacter eurypsychrophilus]